MTLSKYSLIITFICALSIPLLSCKESDPEEAVVIDPMPMDTTIIAPIEPSIANTIGFFLDDWKPKTFTAPSFTEAAVAGTTSVTVTVDASSVITKIPLAEFGNNSVWWMGNPNAQAITDVTNLHPHVIRFPGGNSANNYFFNKEQDQLPADVPATYIDKDGNKLAAGYNYGKSNHNWEFTLDMYYNMLQQTGNQGLISVNYSYARYSTAANPVASAAHLAADWVRYDNGRTQYWEIGNENYGNWQAGYRIDLSLNKDNQPEFITGKLYAQHAKVFIDSMQNAAKKIGKKIYIGVVIHESPSTESWQTATTKTWNSGLLPELNNKADYYVVHNYFTPSSNVNSAGILSAALTVPGKMMEYVSKDLQTYGATNKPMAFNEWNMFALGSKQQVSNVSGLFAVVVLGESIKNKYGMAARWDMLNGWGNGDDHGLFSAGDEPGIPKWNPRPSFYYMYYFQKLLGDRMVTSTVAGSSLVLAYSSTYTSGQANVTLVNTGATPQIVEVKTKNFRMGSRFYWYSLEGGTDNGEFSRKVLVNGTGPTLEAGGPKDYANLKARSAVTSTGIKVTVPARGAVILVVDKK